MSAPRVNPGRVPFWDDRSDAYRIRAVMPSVSAITEARERRYRYWWPRGHLEDQGATPHCTAAALLHWREDGPITTKGPASIRRADLYARIQAQDRAEGRWFAEGATSLAMAKVARALGWCGEFRWGRSLDELIAAVLTAGPVLVGTWWTTGMHEPDAHGMLRYAGAQLGGHEYLVNGVSLDREVFRIKNSWGVEWSHNGMAWIPFADMERLIADDGDVLLVRELPEAKP